MSELSSEERSRASFAIQAAIAIGSSMAAITAFGIWRFLPIPAFFGLLFLLGESRVTVINLLLVWLGSIAAGLLLYVVCDPQHNDSNFIGVGLTAVIFSSAFFCYQILMSAARKRAAE